MTAHNVLPCTSPTQLHSDGAGSWEVVRHGHDSDGVLPSIIHQPLESDLSHDTLEGYVPYHHTVAIESGDSVAPDGSPS